MVFLVTSCDFNTVDLSVAITLAITKENLVSCTVRKPFAYKIHLRRTGSAVYLNDVTSPAFK